MTRSIRHRYADPVDEIWLAAAGRLGISIERSKDAYASYDGNGVLRIAEPGQLDPDDCLAQLVFHELCHALVMGDRALATVDWGLANEDQRDLVLEHACQRLQAALADRHGLRCVMGVTTDHRPYWDALPDDPLAPGDDPAIELARAAWVRSRSTPWRGTLNDALSATAAIARTAQPFAGKGSLWREPAPVHQTGMPLHRDANRACGDCAWLITKGGARPQLRCRQTRDGALDKGQRVEATWRACQRFELRLDEHGCGRCGACCREGFDLVQVTPRERMRRAHPELITQDRHGLCVPRPGGRCVALDGSGARDAPYRCRVYEDRPRACAQFEVGGDACLLARRRLGLSQ